MPAPARQTQSYLRGLFARRGISPRHHLGQNFLVDLNIHELIVDSAEVVADDLILEVGTGAGALTALMGSRGATVVAVEVDPGMATLTREAVADMPAVRVVHSDALANKNSLSPALISAVEEAQAASPGRSLKLVANLPYSVATPVISNLLVSPRLSPSLLVVTIQRELADRMIAEPSSSGYGSLSILVQALGDVEIVRVLQPQVFWPRPKVESAVVRIRPSAERRASIDVPWFHDVVRKAFLHRRKNLRHVLSGMWPDRWTKPDVDAFLAPLSIDPSLRAEALTVPQFLSLADALKARWGTAPAEGQEEPEEGESAEPDRDDEPPAAR